MSLKNVNESPASSSQMSVKPAGGESSRKTHPYAGESGMCVRCKEWTEVGQSCCGAGVWFEGGFIADFEDDDGGDAA